MNSLKQLSEVNGFGISFVFLPINTKTGVDHMALLKNLAKNARIAVIDLEEMMNQQITVERKRQLFVPNDPCHLNREGHQVTATLLDSGFASVLARLTAATSNDNQ